MPAGFTSESARMRTVKVNGKPQEQHYEVHIPERVLLAHPTEDKVFSSYWIEPTKFTPSGRWYGWCEGQTPRAWMAYPDHPDTLTDEAKTRRSKALDELGALDGEERT